MYPKAIRIAKQWIVLLLILVGGGLTGLLVEPYVSLLGITMIYIVVVVIAAYTLSRNKSILCAILAVASLNFFFAPPRFTLHVDGSEHLIALGAFLIVTLIINSLVVRLKNETEYAKRNEARARQLQTVAIDIANAENSVEVHALATQAFQSAFTNRTAICFSDGQQALGDIADLSQELQDGLYACINEAKIIGAGTGRWTELDHWFIPIGEQGMFGALCVQNASAHDFAGREHALALASLIAQGMRRLQLSHHISHAQKEIERRQLQTMFLSAISHDLRTPLSVVIGAASALQSQGEKLDATEQKRLLATIIDEAAYLCTITENTLQLVKLKDTHPALRTDWESMEEIIGTVLQRIKQRQHENRIRYQIETGLPLIQVDAVLIAQLINNLVDNALKYSEEKITLEVTLLVAGKDQLKPAMLQICVKDRGPGIPIDEQESIFEAYTHSRQHDQSSQRGAGLGLAVCRAIARAHGGDLSLKERHGGGSNFIVRLPLPATSLHALPPIQDEEKS